MRRRRATHEDMAGFIAAAIRIGSASAGSSIVRRKVYDGLLGQGAHARVRENEVADLSVRRAAHSVDARHKRKLVVAGVVRPVGLGPDSGMQPDGQDVDERLVRSLRSGRRVLLVAGCPIEGGDNGCVHG
jgi:hypothetical protein